MCIRDRYSLLWPFQTHFKCAFRILTLPLFSCPLCNYSDIAELLSQFVVPVCCFLKVARTVAQHCMEGMREEKLYFPLVKSGKRKKAPLGQRVSTHFVADCSFWWKLYTGNPGFHRFRALGTPQFSWEHSLTYTEYLKLFQWYSLESRGYSAATSEHVAN